MWRRQQRARGERVELELSSSTASAQAKPGATIRASIVTPTTDPNPLLVNDTGGAALISQTGEFLIVSEVAGGNLRLQPVLATSWRPNADASVWTFSLRKGVRFHDGRAMTARDVVYSFKLQTDPKSASNALSTFKGVLSPDGVHQVDEFTVAFHLDAPNGNFPYLCSSDNYNMIILPHGYDPHDWPKTFIGTGPFKLKSFTSQQGAAFVRNPGLLGHRRAARRDRDLLLRVDPGSGPGAAELRRRRGDPVLGPGRTGPVDEFRCQRDRPALQRAPRTLDADRPRPVLRSAGPSGDRVVPRSAGAIATALFMDHAQVGNDSPFAPIFPSTDSAVPQRVQDLTKAKQLLLAAAGHPNGFSTKLYTESLLEIPALAQIIKQQASKIGVDIALDVETASSYYGKAVPGQSDWLDGTMSLVDYAHRGVPNVFLEAPLESKGVWNAARFNDPKYDALVKQYVAAVDLSSQRSVAGRIERLLLAETPIIYPYFYSYLAATASNVSGVQLTPTGQLFLQGASLA